MTDDRDISSGIEQIQTDLARAYAFRRLLEDDIIDLTTPGLAGPGDMISALPVELFTAILYQVVLSDPIHRLMLVSRSWHRTILVTPELWSIIRIKVPLSREKVKQCAAYCTLCMQRSAEYPLDISIDYTGLRPVHELAVDFVHELGEMMPADGYPAQILSLLTRRRKLHDAHGDRYLKPLIALCGPRFSGMTRWRSFSLNSNDYRYDMPLIRAMFIAKVLEGETPLLESLRLHHLSAHVTRNNLILKLPLRRVSSAVNAFPNLSNLRCLVLNNIEAPLNVDQIEGLKITELDLVAYNASHYRFVLRCQNLTKLRFGVKSAAHKIACMDSEFTGPIVFHRLLHLQLSQYIPREFWKQLVVPLLETIVIEDFMAFSNIAHIALLPSVQNLELRYPSMNHGWHDILKCGFRSIIQSLPSITTILCTQWNRTAVEGTLCELSSEEFRSSTLTTLLIIPYGTSNYATDPASYLHCILKYSADHSDGSR